MNAGAESAVRATLALAAEYQRRGVVLSAQVQKDILAEVWVRNNRGEAIQGRDAALVRAFDLMGRSTPVRMLHEMLASFEVNVWPAWRLIAQAPDSATPLHKALFDACRAAGDGAINLPDERQLRRILTSRYLNVTTTHRK